MRINNLNKSIAISSFIFLSVVSALYYFISTKIGPLAYFWDDPYIHLAVAESIAVNGFPSADGYSTSMASSSPLWTFLLVGIYYILSAANALYLYVQIPLILNIIFGILTIFTVSYLLVNRWYLSIFVVVLAPLPAVVFVGMEHMLQIFLVSLLLLISKNIQNELNAKSFQPNILDKQLYVYAIVSALAVATRYELSIFAASLIIFTFYSGGIKELISSIDYHKVKLGVIAGAIAAPILVTGIWLSYHGLFFLPDSVSSKSITSGNGIWINIRDHFDVYFHIKSIFLPLLFPVITAGIVFWLREIKGQTLETASMAYAFGVMGLFHLLLAGPAFLRYDAYISAFAVIPLFEIFFVLRSKQACKLGAMFASYGAVVIGTLLLTRGLLGIYGTYIGAGNINDQQLQTARFFNDFASEHSVALNDLGAVAYFTDVKILDMVGLGSHDISLIYKHREPTGDDLVNKISEHNIKWAVYYPNWFEPQRPALQAACQPVGVMELKKNFICGGNKVVFNYCGKELNGLANARKEFTSFADTVAEQTKNRASASIIKQ